MGNIFYSDFRDFLASLNKHNVRYLLVVGYAVVFHGYARTTGDLDIWVDRTIENYKSLINSFHSFGMPVFDMTEDSFLDIDKFEVFRFGRKPVAIDIMTKMADLEFLTCYERKQLFEDEGLVIPVVHLQDLLQAKKLAHRHKDMDDIRHLEKDNI